MKQLVEPIQLPNGKWAVPDAREFISGCHWENGKFVVPETINGVIEFDNKTLAEAEGHLLYIVMYEARKLEALG